MADQGVRDGLIHLAWAKASFNGTQGIFSDFYNGVSGRGEDFARWAIPIYTLADNDPDLLKSRCWGDIRSSYHNVRVHWQGTS